MAFVMKMALHLHPTLLAVDSGLLKISLASRDLELTQTRSDHDSCHPRQDSLQESDLAGGSAEHSSKA